MGAGISTEKTLVSIPPMDMVHVICSLLGRSPGEENGNPLQYSCLENSMDRGAWWATVHWGCKDSDTAEHAHVINDPLHIKCGVTRELRGKSACRGA